GILGARNRFTDVAYTHRRAVAIGDDDVVPGGGVLQLIVGVDGEAARRPVDVALRPVDGRDRQRHAHLFQRHPARIKLRRVNLYANGRLLLAADGYLADAVKL